MARHRPDPLGGPAASARPRQQELRTIDHDFVRALGALTIAAAYLRSLLAEMDIAMRDAPDRPGPASTWSAYARELLEHAERVDAAIPTARFSGSTADHVVVEVPDGTDTVADARHLDLITSRMVRHRIHAVMAWPLGSHEAADPETRRARIPVTLPSVP